jgi:iron complex outermembrane receptor protein
LSFDLTLFRNQYHGLASLEVGTSFIDPQDGRTVFPVVNMNLTDGHSQGFEALINLQPVSFWQLTASYSNIYLHLDPHGQDVNRGRFIAGSTPRHQLGLQSRLDLSHSLQLDVTARYESRIEQIPAIVDGSGLHGYTEADLRLGWRLNERMEFSLLGQNLLHARHIEFGTQEQRGEIQRSVFAKFAWSF